MGNQETTVKDFFEKQIRAHFVQSIETLESVGDNKEEIAANILRVDPELGRRRKAEVSEMKAGRDQEAVSRSLEKIRAAAHTDENMMPLLVEAVEAYTTVGEICSVLREEWGEYQEVMTI